MHHVNASTPTMFFGVLPYVYTKTYRKGTSIKVSNVMHYDHVHVTGVMP